MALSSLEGAGEARPKTRPAALPVTCGSKRCEQAANELAREGQTSLAGNLDGGKQNRGQTEIVVFIESYTVTCAMAVECLKTDRVTTLVFLEIPAEHYKNF